MFEDCMPAGVLHPAHCIDYVAINTNGNKSMACQMIKQIGIPLITRICRCVLPMHDYNHRVIRFHRGYVNIQSIYIRRISHLGD